MSWSLDNGSSLGTGTTTTILSTLRPGGEIRNLTINWTQEFVTSSIVFSLCWTWQGHFVIFWRCRDWGTNILLSVLISDGFPFIIVWHVFFFDTCMRTFSLWCPPC